VLGAAPHPRHRSYFILNISACRQTRNPPLQRAASPTHLRPRSRGPLSARHGSCFRAALSMPAVRLVLPAVAAGSPRGLAAARRVKQLISVLLTRSAAALTPALAASPAELFQPSSCRNAGGGYWCSQVIIQPPWSTAAPKQSEPSGECSTHAPALTS
jgi:hypothetical protein